MRQAFADTLKDVGLQDEKLVVLVGDISHNILKPYAEACPGRYYNVGIMEPTMVGMAAGLALAGLRPVVHTIAPFLIERSYEQWKLDFGYQELGGVAVSVGGAFDYSGLGCSHHCYTDLALMQMIPGSVVVAPASPGEFDQLFRQTYDKKQLTYFRLSEKHGYLKDVAVDVGKAVKVKEGNRITIIAVGPQLKTAIEADVPGAEIIYVHTVQPLDVEMIMRSLAKTDRYITLEESSRIGSVGERLAWSGVEGQAITLPDEFQRGYGSRQDHLNNIGFTVQRLRDACR